MFHRMLPTAAVSKRNLSSVDDAKRADGKENRQPNVGTRDKQDQPKSRVIVEPRDSEREVLVENGAMQRAFERMLDDLQIPPTLRPKLQGLETPVKAAMVRSNQVLTLTAPGSPPRTPRNLRKTRSSEIIKSSSPFNDGPPYATTSPASPVFRPFEDGDNAFGRYVHIRGLSLDMPRSSSHPQVTQITKEEVIPTSHSLSSKLSKESKNPTKDVSPAKFCTMLANTSSTQLEVEAVKKLRLLLRNESTTWTESFLCQGGYSSLLKRLNEILEVEWREEQHDDQVLHELLRCFKALSTSSIGCFALRSSCPTPFVQLVSLLYSEKKPGDVCSRQLIIELLTILIDLYPTPGDSKPTSIALPAPHTTRYALLRALLLTPAPPRTESPATPISPHAFMASLHLPRIFKTYLQELSDICRDYFWVFCHPDNTIWNLADTDTEKVERPKAPGGMTGGVEFEAMGYLTLHFRLINALAKDAYELGFSPQHEHSAHRLHSDLFASGIGRIIMISRKASTTYYPTLHLELARYISLALQARYELPWSLSRAIGSPPTLLLKSNVIPLYEQSPGSSPTKNRTTAGQSPRMSMAGGPPMLPPPRKVEALKF